MGRKINIEEVRGFLEASNRQFEQGGIYLERALFKRDDNGVLTGITLSYEDRTTSDTQETRNKKGETSMKNVTRCKITLSNGQRYTLRDPEDIGGIDSNRTALFVFNNGQIYRGCTDGEVDDDGDFCLSKKDTHHRIGLPFDRLLGWAYEKEG